MMNLVIKWTLFGAFALFIWAVIFSLYVYYIYTHPPRYVSSLTPKDYGLEYEVVDLNTIDGVKLRGWFIKSPIKDAPVIIGCHGYPFDKGNILDLATFLYPDYSLFLFDFRGMGESEGAVTSVAYHELKDLDSAVRYLNDRGIVNIGAIGFSQGAAVILQANNTQIRAIVADSTFKDMDSMIDLILRRLGPLKWLLNKLLRLWTRVFLKIDMDAISPIKNIKFLKCPVLFIHGGLDSQIPFEHSEELYSIAKTYGKDAEIWIVPGADHGQGYYVNPIEYERRVKGFFNRILGLNKSTS